MRRQITPEQHGIIDYGFSAIQFLGPKVLKLNKKTTNLYQVMGAKVLLVNSLTDTPVGLTNMISFKDHKKADLFFLLSTSALTLAKPIRKNKKSLIFHLAFLGLAAANYYFTNYKGR